MDWEAFERDVWDSVNTSLWSGQWGSLDDSNPDSGFTGRVVTIGETWQGTLYGTTEHADGSKNVYMFSTEEDQADWYASNTDNWSDNECSCTNPYCQV